VPKKNNPEGSLLLIRTSAMGDVAMLYPVLRAVSRKYPRLKLKLLTNPLFAPLFSGIDTVELIPFRKDEHGSLIGLFRLFLDLSREPYTAVLDLHGVLRSRLLCTGFFLSGRPIYRIDKGRGERKELLARGWRECRPLKPVHDRYAEAFARAGFPIEWGDGTRWVEECNRSISEEQRIGLAPFARHPGKQYPLDQMESVIEALLADKRRALLLFGAPGSEADLLDLWVRRWPGRVRNLAGSLNFAQQLEEMKSLSLMISMDSGNGHLAANFGLPVLTLWGTTHPHAGFRPYGQPDQHQLTPDEKHFPKLPASIYGPTRDPFYLEAISSIPPTKVAETANKILNGITVP